MDLKTYKEHLSGISLGKRLPNSIYLHREALEQCPRELSALLSSVFDELDIDDSYNVVKFHTNALKISFLAYPEFFSEPHPTLARSTVADLAHGTFRKTDYSGRANPPILHRKETFLAHDHARAGEFAQLTRQEEAAGLYENSKTIGFKENWSRLLAEKGYCFKGHSLVRIDAAVPAPVPTRGPEIARHKTAIQRGDLSKPTKLLLEHGLLTPKASFFDYGCGLGTDVAGLSELGYSATGWDPVHAPNNEKNSDAQVVNLGFVLNVIEDPAERVETLIDAWAHTHPETGVLAVSTLVAGRETYACARPLGDGVVTSRGTFQKYFEQTELQAFIEDALHADAVPLALGFFLVFRDQATQEDFISNRSKRSIDWEQISHRLRAFAPKRGPRLSLYEQHAELLDDFWRCMLELGRQPKKDEYSRYEEIRKTCRSANTAASVFIEKYGEEPLDEARTRRKEDLLVYLAAGEFQKRRTPFTHLSPRLRTDIKTFFGNYAGACDQAREVLFSAGDPDELEIAIEDLEFGWIDAVENHFSFHRDLLTALPPILRMYVESGARLYGDPEQADIIKIHLGSGKLTLLHYDDFEKNGFPVLETRIKIDLRRFFVNVFDYSTQKSQQLLFFKERFIAPDHPQRPKLEAVSRRLRKLGITESMLGSNDRHAPDKDDFAAALKRLGLTWSLTKKP